MSPYCLLVFNKILLLEMNHKKTVKVSNPILKTLHNNLRLLWKVAVADDLGKIGDEKDKILEEFNRIYTGKETIPDRYRIIHKKWENLVGTLSDSICKCATCSKTDSDMTYSVRDECWYCTDCYEQSHFYYDRVEDKRAFPHEG